MFYTVLMSKSCHSIRQEEALICKQCLTGISIISLELFVQGLEADGSMPFCLDFSDAKRWKCFVIYSAHVNRFATGSYNASEGFWTVLLAGLESFFFLFFFCKLENPSLL